MWANLALDSNMLAKKRSNPFDLDSYESNDEHKNCEDEQHNSSSCKKSITKGSSICTWTIRREYPLKFKSSRWHSEKQQTSGCLQIWFVLRAATTSNKTASIKLFQFDCDSSLLVCAGWGVDWEKCVKIVCIPSVAKPVKHSMNESDRCVLLSIANKSNASMNFMTHFACEAIYANKSKRNKFVEHVSGFRLFIVESLFKAYFMVNL